MCCYKYTSPDYTKYWDWEAWYNAWRYVPYIHYRDINANHLLLNDPGQWWWWGVRPDYGCSWEAEFIT
ncbi:fibrillin-3, partial [Biomphalaria pfeifferi]